MNPFQIVLIILVLLYIFARVKKYLQTKNIVNYTVDEAALKTKNSKNVILLDVRTDAERAGGFIKGSVHKPLHLIKLNIDELNKFKDKEIICYCQSGSRSVSAAVILNKNGFNAANLAGGYSRWK